MHVVNTQPLTRPPMKARLSVSHSSDRVSTSNELHCASFRRHRLNPAPGGHHHTYEASTTTIPGLEIRLLEPFRLSRPNPLSDHMCLINLRSKEEPEVVVPSRPIAVRPLSVHSQLPPSIRPAAPIPLQPRTSTTSYQHISPRTSHISPRASQISQSYRLEPISSQTQPQPHGQVVVIQQRTPRTSGQLPIREGEDYGYGEGPVTIRRQSSRAQQAPKRGSMAGQGYRRSGSVGNGKDPRMSNASWRSTRERIVVVDGAGTRREYYR